VLRDLPISKDPNLLVGSSNADDAGVYKISDEVALIQTLDFFTPIVDDPFLFGQIAAANSLSDVYAMGGKPLTAMAIAGMPNDLPVEVIKAIFEGGAQKVIESGASLVGGHTVKNPEPLYGLSVTGSCHPDKFLSNDQLSRGDVLILTKPLGTGIAASALKIGKSSKELQEIAVESMTSLNISGAKIAERGLSKACTDITGFGLIGHALEMCRASNLGMRLVTKAIPPLSPEIITLIEGGCVPGGTKANLESCAEEVEFDMGLPDYWQYLLADAQTSGGLLIATSMENQEEVLQILKQDNALCANIIGSVVYPYDAPAIQVV